MTECNADGCDETARYAIGNNNLPIWLCKQHYLVFNELYEDTDPLPTATH